MSDASIALHIACEQFQLAAAEAADFLSGTQLQRRMAAVCLVFGCLTAARPDSLTSICSRIRMLPHDSKRRRSNVFSILDRVSS